MGKRGPLSQPKPSNPRRKPTAVPDAPELPPEIEVAWKAYWTSEVAEVTDPVDLPLIRRLFALYAQHADTAKVVATGLVVKGSVGQIRLNPLADHLLKLETAILRLENELGLTPMSRARLGIFLQDLDEDLKKSKSIVDELAMRRALNE